MSSDTNFSDDKADIVSFQFLIKEITDSFYREIQSNDNMSQIVEPKVQQIITSTINNTDSKKGKIGKIFLKTNPSENFKQQQISDTTLNLDQTVKKILDYSVPKMIKDALQKYFQPIGKNLNFAYNALQELNQQNFDDSNQNLNNIVEEKINFVLASFKNSYIQFSVENFNTDIAKTTQEISLDIKVNPAVLKPFIKILVESYGIKKQISKIEFNIVSEITITGIKINNKKNLVIDLGNLDGVITLFLKKVQMGTYQKEIDEKEIMIYKINFKLPKIRF